MRTPMHRALPAGLPAALFSVLSALFAPCALAQQPASDAPPKLEKLEEGEAPAITIRKGDGQAKITEKREGGRVTEATVQSGKSTYTVKPSDQQPGNAQPGDAQSGARAAQWKVLEFDLSGRVKNTAEPEGTQADNRVPPPPAPEAAPAKK